LTNYLNQKSISILGATGSIGDSTLDLIRHHKEKYDVRVLTAGANVQKLIKLAQELSPQYVAIADESKHAEFKSACPNIEILNTEEAASVDADWTMAAIVGTAGLIPTMNAIKRGKQVAFASKECLVAAGTLMMDAVKQSGAKLLPVDSEHNAIYQVFDECQRDKINRLILTASGGPFREKSYEQMAGATVQQAVAHPTWSMGAKISVDSATLMNKALEVIEAHYLFDMPSEKIDVIIHPQSLIHSCVEYIDGSILSQMGPSDMKTPIAYCLGWPERIETPSPLLNFDQVRSLTFEQPDIEKFKSLKMVRDVLNEGQAASIIFNASNEIANKAFLDGQIALTAIYDVIEFCLIKTERLPIASIEDVVEQDNLARRAAESRLKS
jgi:1-deoxy-D-xylulose-5-phosphate reductoisomerase